MRHGDPLSSFLFILVVEGLVIAMNEGCEQHFYQGITFSNDDTRLFNLMYADNVTFTSEWFEVNLVTLNRIMRCFFLAYGLKVNLHCVCCQR